MHQTTLIVDQPSFLSGFCESQLLSLSPTATLSQRKVMSRKKILFPQLGKYYEAALSERLTSEGYEVMQLSDGQHFELFYSDLCLSSSGSTTIIVDVDNTECVLSIIRSVYPAMNRPKLVLITSLLTWCGETSEFFVEDPDVEFYNRKPLRCALKTYGLENILWNMACDPLAANNITYFIGTGLIYGESGWDFESALRYQVNPQIRFGFLLIYHYLMHA